MALDHLLLCISYMVVILCTPYHIVIIKVANICNSIHCTIIHYYANNIHSE